MSIKRGILNVLVGTLSVGVGWMVLTTITSASFVNSLFNVVLLAVTVYALNLVGRVVLNLFSGTGFNPLAYLPSLPSRKRAPRTANK